MTGSAAPSSTEEAHLTSSHLQHPQLFSTDSYQMPQLEAEEPAQETVPHPVGQKVLFSLS